MHLAVQFELTAAINSVLVFDASTGTTLGDGRTRSAPSPCPAVGNSAYGEFDPVYLASGALTYVVRRISGRGAAGASPMAWQAGRLTTLFSVPTGLSPFYDMTAQGQATWASGPAEPKGPQTIWRWSGGVPAEIAALPPLGASPYYGVGESPGKAPPASRLPAARGPARRPEGRPRTELAQGPAPSLMTDPVRLPRGPAARTAAGAESVTFRGVPGTGHPMLAARLWPARGRRDKTDLVAFRERTWP